MSKAKALSKFLDVSEKEAQKLIKDGDENEEDGYFIYRQN